MTNKNGRKGNNVGVGLVAVGAALAAGYYFYVSGNAKKNRKIVGSWAINLKDEVLNKARNIKDGLNKESLLNIIDEVAANYYVAKNATKEDVQALVSELKQNWSKVLGELKNTKKSIKIVKSKAKAKKDNS